jgi:cysteine-rich repeat protein
MYRKGGEERLLDARGTCYGPCMRRAIALLNFGWLGVLSMSCTPPARGYAVGALETGSTATAGAAGSGSTLPVSATHSGVTAAPADSDVTPPGASSAMDASVTDTPTNVGDASEPTPGPCGNGVVEDDERCDDGNRAATDGCGATCRIEDGWACGQSEPTQCQALCGDGLLVGAEAETGGCDDANLESQDGCSSGCQVESGYECDGAPSSCDEDGNVPDTCDACVASAPTLQPTTPPTMAPPVMSSAPISDVCVVGQTQGSEVAVIGDSFISISAIPERIEQRAKAAGSLAESDGYLDNAVAGSTLANNEIGSQYDQAVTSSGTIKYVLMNGGATDCQTNDGDAALAAAEALFETMAQNNTEKVVYFFYADPIGSSYATLKTCLDTLRPQMKALCDGLTLPKCYFLDLRGFWDGHSEYTSDGIHPTAAGSDVTGDAIWDVMVENCVAQ